MPDSRCVLSEIQSTLKKGKTPMDKAQEKPVKSLLDVEIVTLTDKIQLLRNNNNNNQNFGGDFGGGRDFGGGFQDGGGFRGEMISISSDAEPLEGIATSIAPARASWTHFRLRALGKTEQSGRDLDLRSWSFISRMRVSLVGNTPSAGSRRWQREARRLGAETLARPALAGRSEPDAGPPRDLDSETSAATLREIQTT